MNKSERKVKMVMKHKLPKDVDQVKRRPASLSAKSVNVKRKKGRKTEAGGHLWDLVVI